MTTTNNEFKDEIEIETIIYRDAKQGKPEAQIAYALLTVAAAIHDVPASFADILACFFEGKITTQR